MKASILAIALLPLLAAAEDIQSPPDLVEYNGVCNPTLAKPISCKLGLYCDVPQDSGLGASGLCKVALAGKCVSGKEPTCATGLECRGPRAKYGRMADLVPGLYGTCQVPPSSYNGSCSLARNGTACAKKLDCVIPDGETVGKCLLGEGEVCNQTVSPEFQKKCAPPYVCVTPFTEGDRVIVGQSGICRALVTYGGQCSEDNPCAVGLGCMMKSKKLTSGVCLVEEGGKCGKIGLGKSKVEVKCVGGLTCSKKGSSSLCKKKK
ncbi:hypothetical protein HDU80_003465 [Chytriomyces hyalinus]|nr:hypothetical protein HDU80_003465 [Chytriomyces hyalinus]